MDGEACAKVWIQQIQVTKRSLVCLNIEWENEREWWEWRKKQEPQVWRSCGKWGPLFIAVRGLLTIAASLVADHRLQTRRLSSCGSRAQWHVGSSQTRGRTRVPCIGRQILNHCAPGKTFIILLNFFFSLSFSNLNMLWMCGSQPFFLLRIC